MRILEEIQKIQESELTLADFWEYKKNLSKNALRTYRYVIRDLNHICLTEYEGTAIQIIQELKTTKDERKMKMGVWRITQFWIDYCLDVRKQHVNTVIARLAELIALLRFFGLKFTRRELMERCTMETTLKLGAMETKLIAPSMTNDTRVHY